MCEGLWHPVPGVYLSHGPLPSDCNRSTGSYELGSSSVWKTTSGYGIVTKGRHSENHSAN